MAVSATEQRGFHLHFRGASSPLMLMRCLKQLSWFFASASHSVVCTSLASHWVPSGVALHLQNTCPLVCGHACLWQLTVCTVLLSHIQHAPDVEDSQRVFCRQTHVPSYKSEKHIELSYHFCFELDLTTSQHTVNRDIHSTKCKCKDKKVKKRVWVLLLGGGLCVLCLHVSPVPAWVSFMDFPNTVQRHAS